MRRVRHRGDRVQSSHSGSLEGKRQALTAAAAEVFARKGYHTASVEDIAITARIGKGTFYGYFGSKQEAALAVLRHSLDRLVGKRRDSLLESDADSSPLLGSARSWTVLTRFYPPPRSAILMPKNQIHFTDLTGELVWSIFRKL